MSHSHLYRGKIQRNWVILVHPNTSRHLVFKIGSIIDLKRQARTTKANLWIIKPETILMAYNRARYTVQSRTWDRARIGICRKALVSRIYLLLSYNPISSANHETQTTFMVKQTHLKSHQIHYHKTSRALQVTSDNKKSTYSSRDLAQLQLDQQVDLPARRDKNSLRKKANGYSRIIKEAGQYSPKTWTYSKVYL